MVSLIVCYSKNRVIGNKGSMPWHIPEDLRRFKELTMGHTLIMGRKTYEAIGHPLEGRSIRVISRSKSYELPTVSTYTSLKSALEGLEDVFICGGAQIYSQVMELVDVMYITELKQEYDGDTFFPELDECLYDSVIEEETDRYTFKKFIHK
ncbi:MAG: dihydrofolate reductase [Erysipelotrichaceae bacterium]|nr:dihydrofolate reductase [Erysipelotrichaceae bacterium]